MLLIGDVHGDWNGYFNLLERTKGLTVQVGDLGISNETNVHTVNNLHYKTNHFIRGNADNYTLSKSTKGFIDDEGKMGDYWFLGGAASAGKEHLIKGYNYWEDEEYEKSNYYGYRWRYWEMGPRVVVTHDAPWSIYAYHHSSGRGHTEKTRTNTLLQELFEIHQPDLWVYGHFHQSKKMTAEGTNFISLDQLEGYMI